MGIDIQHKHVKSSHRKAPKSNNVYLKMLVKLYSILARRTESPFNKLILKRLVMSRTNRPPLSLSKLAFHLRSRPDQIAVIVGTVTNDERLLECPKMTVAAMHFTENARARILKAGGEVLTFDQLALRSPAGENAVVLQGKRSARKALKYFGVPGGKHSHTKNRQASHGRKFERARGKR